MGTSPPHALEGKWDEKAGQSSTDCSPPPPWKGGQSSMGCTPAEPQLEAFTSPENTVPGLSWQGIHPPPPTLVGGLQTQDEAAGS